MMLMDGYDVADACYWAHDPACPYYWESEFSWNAGGPQHAVAASLALDGYPARATVRKLPTCRPVSP